MSQAGELRGWIPAGPVPAPVPTAPAGAATPSEAVRSAALGPPLAADPNTGAGLGLGIEYASYSDADDDQDEVAGLRPPPASPRRFGRWPGLVLIALGLTLIAVGAYSTYQDGHGHHPGVQPGISPSPSAPAASGSPAGHRESPGPDDTTPGDGATSSAGLGTSVVTVAPALRGQPDVADITGTLSTYFTAINQRDFTAYSSVLIGVDQRVRDEQEFLDNFRSTHDSQVWLVGVRRDSTGEVFATVTFRSQQDPKDSPDLTSDCLSWVVTYPMARVDGILKIDVVRNFAVTHRPC